MCYANCAEVTLTLNDKVIGTKKLSETTNSMLRWQVPYEPGELKAIGRSGGSNVCEYTLQTAGPASRIELLPDSTQLRADGKDVCHLEFRIVDAQSVRVPDANAEVTFEFIGPAPLLGIVNGDVNSPDAYQSPTHKAFRGRGLAILQSTTAAGKVVLKASAPSLESATINLEASAGKER